MGMQIQLPVPPGLISGSVITTQVPDASGPDRESALKAFVLSGNVPTFMRTLTPVTASANGHTCVYFVTPDFVGVGTDNDWFRIPLTPQTAQSIATSIGCTLPTKLMVDQIYAASSKQIGKSIPPGQLKKGDSLADHVKHDKQHVGNLPSGQLHEGHKKNVIMTPRVFGTNRVAVYGFFKANGQPNHPFDSKSLDKSYMDYTHGIRFVARACVLDGNPADVFDILRDPNLYMLLCDEFPFDPPTYTGT